MERDSSQCPSQTSSSSSPPENLVESFIGSSVYLISNDDKRYEGVICHFNPQDSTLGLKNVRCYGRAGRDGKSNIEIQISQLLTEVYSDMSFRESDIKDLKVLSAPPKHDIVVGHVISLITREDIRCEGLITHIINLDGSLIFIKDVRCYGTEGRKRRRRLGCNQLDGPIHFKLRDIKEVEVIFADRILLQEGAAPKADGFPPLSKTHIHGNNLLPSFVT